MGGFIDSRAIKTDRFGAQMRSVSINRPTGVFLRRWDPILYNSGKIIT